MKVRSTLGQCWTVLCTLLTTVWASVTLYSDGCDWSGSGLPHNQYQGVVPVRLWCAEGKVSWSYPHGALRVTLHLPGAPKFRACVKVAPGWPRGAALHLQGPEGHLEPLVGGAAPLGSTSEEHCMESQGGKVVLYVETLPGEVKVKRSKVNFMYDLQSWTDWVADRKRKEDGCSPCSDEEVLMAFCSSDFVARATMTTWYDEQQAAELSVQVHTLYRDKSQGDVFHVQSAPGGGKKPAAPPSRQGQVRLPSTCGYPSQGGHRRHSAFLMTGDVRLGVAHLHCAPTWDEWRRIRDAAVAGGRNPCRLS